MAPRPEVSGEVMRRSQCEGLRLTSGFKTYPRHREKFLKSAYEWMEGKVKVDGVWPYWRIYDKLYDLSDFMDNHPGGKFWIETTRGSDITEAFESSHFGPKAPTILKKYYVKDISIPRNSPFTFKDDGFYMTLKRKVTPILQKHGTGPNSECLLIQDGLLVMFITFMVFGGWYSSTFMLILAGILLGMAAYAAHNFFHQRDNWRMYIFDAFLASSREWRISHALSHHVFPNTIYDFEIAMLEPHLEFFPKPNKSRFLKYLVPVWTTLLILISAYYDSIRRMFYTRKYHWTHLITATELIFLIIVQKSLLQGFISWYIMQTTAAAYIIIVGLTVSHHHPDIFREGDKLPKERDWGLLQLYATRDRSYVVGSLFLSAISFGNHTLHHLFPTVDMSKLALLYDPLLETCKEFGLDFQFTSVWDLVRGTYLAAVNSKSNHKLPNMIKDHNLIQ